MENLLEKLEKILPKENIKQNEPMKKHTSFRIGGLAEFFVKVNSVEALIKLLELTNKDNIPLFIIGNGSNILVSDEGLNGIVAKLDMKEIKINTINNNQKEIIVDAGVPLGLLAQKLLQEKIKGFEELSGIPGTIGGAVIMNAGAYGKEIKDITTEVMALDYEGKIHKFTNEEAQFEYRHSIFSSKKYIVLQVKLLLEIGEEKEIKEKMYKYLQSRKEKQPIEYPSAGSTFKRGENFITAQLIDEAGLKGYSIGDAQVSEKHAGFVINKGNATSEDVIKLTQYIKETVYKKFRKNIELEIEILENKTL